MKPEIRFIQHAIGLNFIKQTALMQFFQSHNFQQIPENIGQILIQERILSLDQFRKIQEKVRREQEAESPAPKELSLSMTIPLENGEIEVPLVEESSANLSSKLATRRLSASETNLQKQTHANIEPQPYLQKQTHANIEPQPYLQKQTHANIEPQPYENTPQPIPESFDLSEPLNEQPISPQPQIDNMIELNEDAIHKTSDSLAGIGKMISRTSHSTDDKRIISDGNSDTLNITSLRQSDVPAADDDIPAADDDIPAADDDIPAALPADSISYIPSNITTKSDNAPAADDDIPAADDDIPAALPADSISYIPSNITTKSDNAPAALPTDEIADALPADQTARFVIPTQQKKITEIPTPKKLMPQLTTHPEHEEKPISSSSNEQFHSFQKQTLDQQAPSLIKLPQQPNTTLSDSLQIVLDETTDIPDTSDMARILSRARQETIDDPDVRRETVDDPHVHTKTTNATYNPQETIDDSQIRQETVDDLAVAQYKQKHSQETSKSLSEIQAVQSTTSSGSLDGKAWTKKQLTPTLTPTSFPNQEQAQGNTQKVSHNVIPRNAHESQKLQESDGNITSKLIKPLESSASGGADRIKTSSAEVQLGKIAVQKKLITVAQLKSCLDEQQKLSQQGNNISLDHLLIRKSLLSPEEIESIKKENQTVEIPKNFPEFGGQEIILGKYRILQKLGSGGMGAVYKVEHTLLQYNRFFALKVMHACFADNETNYKRFVREVEVAMGLVHRNIVAIREFGLLPSQAPYLIMDFCAGKTLEAILQSQWNCDLLRSIDIVQQILDGVIEAHKCNVIHRDLKPANVLIEQSEGRDLVKIVDFGLAKLSEESEHLESLTQGILGTPLYMSPEQAGGERVDKRSDLYSVGMILYEMTAGTLPFKTRSLREMLVKQMFEAPTPPHYHNENIPNDLEEVILRALIKNPDERFQTAQEFWQALDDCGIKVVAKEQELANRRASTAEQRIGNSAGRNQNIATRSPAQITSAKPPMADVSPQNTGAKPITTAKPTIHPAPIFAKAQTPYHHSAIQQAPTSSLTDSEARVANQIGSANFQDSNVQSNIDNMPPNYSQHPQSKTHTPLAETQPMIPNTPPQATQVANVIQTPIIAPKARHTFRNLLLFLILVIIIGYVTYCYSATAREYIDHAWLKIKDIVESLRPPERGKLDQPVIPPVIPQPPIYSPIRDFPTAIEDVKNNAKRKMWDDAYTALVTAKQLAQNPREIQDVQDWERYLMDRKQEEREYQKARDSSNLAHSRHDYKEAIRFLQEFNRANPNGMYDTDVRKRIQELVILEEEATQRQQQELQQQLTKLQEQLKTVMEQKDWNQANQIVTQLIEICPSDMPEIKQFTNTKEKIQQEILEEKDYQKTKELVLRARERKAYKEAIQLWEEFLTRFKTTSRSTDIQNEIAFIKNLQTDTSKGQYTQMILEAKDLLRSKNYTKALEILNTAKKFRNQDTEIFGLMGMIYYQRKDFKNAQSYFEAGDKHLSGSMRIMLADTQAKQNNYTKAIVSMNKAIAQLLEEQATPQQLADCYNSLGSYYQKNSNDTLAITAYQKVADILERDGGTPPIKYREMYQNLALLCARNNKIEETLKAVRVYQNLGGKDQQVLGLVLEFADFSPLAVGKKWTYSKRFGNKKSQNNVEIVDQYQTHYLVKIDKEVSEEWFKQGDFFMRYYRKTGITEKTLKYPVRLNSTWVNQVQNQESQYKIVETGLTITVEAGKFNNCIKIAAQTSPVMWSYIYYAPQVGKIKQENVKQDTNPAQIMFEEELISHE